MEEVAGGLRRLHSKELHNLYVSPNFIRAIKSRMSHVSRLGHIQNAYKILVGNVREETTWKT